MKTKTFAVLAIGGAAVLAANYLLQTPQQSWTVTPVSESKAPLPVTKTSPLPKDPSKTNHPEDSNREIARTIKQLHLTESCYKSSQCPFDQSDSRSYDLAVGQKLKSLLDRLRTQLQPEDLNSPDTAELARHFLGVSDGHVKSSALELLSLLPPSSKNLQAVLQHVVQHHDAVLIPKAIEAMVPYLGTAEEGSIHTTLQQTLTTGSHYVGKTLALHLSPLLSLESISGYQEVLATWPNKHPLKGLLESQLAEAQRQLTGG